MVVDAVLLRTTDANRYSTDGPAMTSPGNRERCNEISELGQKLTSRWSAPPEVDKVRLLI